MKVECVAYLLTETSDTGSSLHVAKRLFLWCSMTNNAINIIHVIIYVDWHNLFSWINQLKQYDSTKTMLMILVMRCNKLMALHHTLAWAIKPWPIHAACNWGHSINSRRCSRYAFQVGICKETVRRSYSRRERNILAKGD